MEFLSENPNVDVSAAWERCWGIQTKIIERVKARYDVKRHPSCVMEESILFQMNTKFMGKWRAHLIHIQVMKSIGWCTLGLEIDKKVFWISMPQFF